VLLLSLLLAMCFGCLLIISLTMMVVVVLELQKLTLSYCSVGPEGAAGLGEYLASPDCALGHLDLMVRSTALHLATSRCYCACAWPCHLLTLALAGFVPQR
jgi:hypothetical protein